MSIEEELDGITGKQFLEELFEYEYCTECGLDADAHTAIPLGLGDYGTNWFARCDHLVECAYCDEEFTTEPVREPRRGGLARRTGPDLLLRRVLGQARRTDYLQWATGAE